MGNGPYDPMEGDTAWGNTGYGTGDPTDGISNWISKYMPWIIGGTMAAGGLQSAGLIPGGGGAAAGAGAGGAATTAVPSMPWTIPAGFDASMGAAPAAGGAIGALGTIAPTGAGVIDGVDLGTGGVSGLAGAGGGIADFLKNPKTYGGLAGLLTTLATARPGGGSGNTAANFNAQYPQLNELLNVSTQRAERLDPLHQSITQLAMSRLPTNMQR